VALLLDRQDFTRAEALARQGAQRAPPDASILASLGLTLYFQGRKPESAETYARAVALAPENRESTEMYARVLVEIGQPQKALDVLRQFSPRASADDRMALSATERELARRVRAERAPAWAEVAIELDLPEQVARPWLGGSWTADGAPDVAARLRPVSLTPVGPASGGRRSFAAKVRGRGRTKGPYLIVAADGPPDGRQPALATMRAWVGPRDAAPVLRLRGEHHAAPAIPSPLTQRLAARERAGAEVAGHRRRVVAIWIDGGSWLLVRKLAAEGRLLALPALERMGASGAMLNPTPSTQEALELFTVVGREAPSLFSMLVGALGQLRLGTGGAGALRAIDPMRLQALDGGGSRSLRDLLAAAHRSYLSLIWSDANV